MDDKNVRVLLVEDNPGDARLVREMLASGGMDGFAPSPFNVVHVGQLSEALAALGAAAFDLILLDLSLPDGQGLDSIRQMLKAAPGVPVVVMSGLKDEGLAVQAVQAGAQDYLVKGHVDEHLLVRAIRYAVERKRAEEALRAREKLFRALIENGSDASAMLSPDGTILYASPSTTRILGYPSEELIGRNGFEFIHPDDQERTQAALADLIQKPGFAARTEWRVNHQNGTWLWVEGVGSNLLEEPSVRAVVVNYRDITERKHTEEAIHFQARLLDAVGQAVVATDLEGSVLYWNSAAETLYGWSAEGVVGRKIREVIPIEITQDQECEIMSRLTIGEQWSGEFLVQRRDGTIFPAIVTSSPIHDDNGKLAGIIGISVDITGRKQAEEALRKSETLLAKAQEIAHLGSWDWDIQADALHWSDETYRIFGLAPQTFSPTYEAFLSTVHPADRELVRRSVTEAVDEGKPYSIDHRIIRPDGSERILHAEGEVVRDRAGRALWMIGTAQDITERKQRERELEAIVTVSTALRSAATRVEMLPVILGQLLDVAKAVGAALAMHDPVSGETVVELGCGAWTQWTGFRLPPGQGVTGHVLATGQPHVGNNWELDPRLLRPDLVGDVRAMARVPLIAQGQPIGVFWIGRETDISAGELRLLRAIADMAANAIHRATLHEQTERRVQRIGALHAIDMTITASLDLRVTLNAVLDQVTSQLGVHAADVLLLDPRTHTLNHAAGRGFRSNAAERTSLRLGEGYVGQAALERRIVHIRDLSAVGAAFLRPRLVLDEGFVVYYAVPLIAKGQVKGLLEIFHREPLDPDAEWLDFLEALAAQAAIAVDNAALFDELQRSNIDLTLAYDTTLEGWSRALDLRDKATEGHTQRVAELTVRLARAMEMSESELVPVRRGALLHDIGKMGIPDRILLKAGPLTDEEWAIMRQHPVYAQKLLSPIPYLRPALDIPYCHHEKWDGTGYPRGLTGEQIPLAARIFAVVDVWDALCSDRPYRGAWSEERAREYLCQQAGQHFDPQVVEAFCRLLDDTMESKPIVLIVDDEEHITRSLARSLRDQFTVLTATSSERALEMIAQVEIAVILTDQRMPGLTGVQLLERARQIRPDALGILISGYSDLNVLVEALNLGTVRGYLHKPWDLAELRRRLREAARQPPTSWDGR